jgi:tetratricopeptide (TPR) repeat protein
MGLATAMEFSLVGLSGGHVYKGVEFLVGSYTPAGDVDGIIGQNVMGIADVEYDLANGFVRLFHAKDCKGAVVAYWRGDASVAEMRIDDTTPSSPHLIGSAKINGKKVRVLFDTGAWRSILDSATAAKVGVKPENDDVSAAGVSSGIGSRTTETYLARFDTLDLGGELIMNARLRIGDLSALGKPDMLLGADFFLSHRIYVSTQQNKLYFTYNGGPVFDLRPSSGSDNSPAATPAVTAAAQLEPGIAAEGFRGRGAASAARYDFPAAIADFDQAIKLAPNDAESYYQRANAQLRSGRPQLALSDLDETLKLKPDYVPALLVRGSLQLGAKNDAGARADFAEAIRLKPNDGGTALSIATIYGTYDRHAEQIELLNAWIAAYPNDGLLPNALNERCWARALLGTELDLALADCNLSLKKGPRNSEVLDSRAFVYLRRGEYDKSIADYKAVLKLQPRQALSMYGLGLAARKKGLTSEGDKNLQAAVAIQGDVAEFYKRLGLEP